MQKNIKISLIMLISGIIILAASLLSRYWIFADEIDDGKINYQNISSVASIGSFLGIFIIIVAGIIFTIAIWQAKRQ